MEKIKIGVRLKVMLWIIRLFQRPIHLSDVAQIKKRSNSKMTAFFSDLFPPKMHEVLNLNIDSGNHRIPVRLYYASATRTLPVILYFHGGGFVIGGIEGYDHFFRRLSKLSGYAVMAVAYRLAPDHKFPAAHRDALISLEWLRSMGKQYQLDIENICVSGDSAGGNLAAYLGFKSREMNMGVKCLALIYPVLDMRKRTKQYYEQFLVGRQTSQWFARQFLSSESDMLNPDISPVLNQRFDNLPGTLLVKAEYDHLNEEIDRFVEQLRGSDVTSVVITAPSTFHGFITMFNWTSEAKRIMKLITEFINDSVD